MVVPTATSGRLGESPGPGRSLFAGIVFHSPGLYRLSVLSIPRTTGCPRSTGYPLRGDYLTISHELIILQIKSGDANVTDQQNDRAQIALPRPSQLGPFFLNNDRSNRVTDLGVGRGMYGAFDSVIMENGA